MNNKLSHPMSDGFVSRTRVKGQPLRVLIGIELSKTGAVGLTVDDIYNDEITTLDQGFRNVGFRIAPVI